MVMSQPAIAGDNVKYYFASFKIEAEFQFAQTCIPHRFPQACLVLFAIQHQKTPAPCSGDFSADCPVPLCELVPGIYLGIRDSLGEPFFRLPVDVQELSKTPPIA